MTPMTSAAPGCGGHEPRGPGRPRDPDVDRLVVDAATDLICEHGFDGLTMEAVARRAGVAKATVYRRFPSKVDLAVAACLATSPPPVDPPETGSLVDDLVVLVQGLVRKIRGSAGGRLMPAMVAASAGNAEVREALRRFSSTRRGNMREVLQRGVDRGEIRADADVDLLADCLVGPIVFRYLVSGRPIGGDTPRRLVEQVLRGAAN